MQVFDIFIENHTGDDKYEQILLASLMANLRQAAHNQIYFYLFTIIPTIICSQ